jgi:hypothetical protein
MAFLNIRTAMAPVTALVLLVIEVAQIFFHTTYRLDLRAM